MANFKFTIQVKKLIALLFLLISGLSFGQTKWTDWTFNSGFPAGPPTISTSLGGAISTSPASIVNITSVGTDYNINTCGAINTSTSPYFEFTINHTATNIDLDRFVMAIKYQVRPTDAYNPNYTYGLDLRTSLDNYATSLGTKTIPNNFDANLISWNLLSLNTTSSSPLKIRVYFYNVNSFVDASNNVYNSIRVQLSNTYTTNLDATPVTYQSTNKAASLWYNTATIPNTTPTVTLSSTTLSAFTACSNAASTAQTFNVSGINLTGSVNFSAVTGYEYSTDGTTYSPTLSLTPSSGTLASTTVSVRLKSSLTPGSPSGTIAISSTGVTTQNIAVTGTIPTAPYPFDRVVNFSAGGHLTKAASASINLINYTVEAWIYPTAWNYLAGIICKRDFQFMTNSNGALSVMIERDWSWELTTTANNVVVLNKWQHVATSYNASTKVVKIYVNGALVHTFTRTQGFVPDFNTYDLRIGYNNGQGNGTPTRNFAGNIDEVKIWNTIRTDAEISTNYTTQLVGNETGLTAYYKFDQGIGGGNNTAITSITDLTANANHLTPASSSPVYAMTGATNNILQVGPAILSSPSICLNTTSTLTHTNTGGTWSTSDASVISINSATGAATANATGSATITYSFTDNGCNYTSTKLFTVLALPAITSQPATSAQNICINGTATALTITATGAGITYQWYKNTTSSNSGGTLIAGATAASYTPITTTAGDTYYYCVVSGTCSPAATSDVSGLIKVFGVSVAGTISSSVASICDSGSAALTLAGNTGTIQWQILDNSVWTDISGETASTYTTPTLSQITSYRAQVTNGPCANVTSSIFSIPLYTSPASPSATTTYNYCPNATATSLSATALSGYSLQWYTQAVGGTASSTAPTPVTTTVGTTTYYVSQKATPTAVTLSTASGVVQSYTVIGTGTSFGQTFSLTSSITLNSITLGYFFNGDLSSLKIYNGVGGALIATSTNTVNFTSGNYTYSPVYNFSNTTLNANQTYYFVLTTASTTYPMNPVASVITGNVYNGATSYPGYDMYFTLAGTSISNPCESPRTAITVNVNANPTISGIQNMTLGGSTLQLSATGTPATTTPWVSSNTSIATISSTGEVTAVAGGSTTITFTTSAGCSVSSVLRVVDCNQPLGNALSFGVGTLASNADFIQVNSRIFPNQSVPNFTIETWIKPGASDIIAGTPGTNWLSFLGYSGTKRSPSLYITNNGALHASWTEGSGFVGTAVSASTPTSLFLNKWTHVALVKDGTTMRLYTNGTQIATVACLANLDVPDNAYWIGKSDQQFSGTLDEVRFWSTARSQADILATMNTELAGNETGLLAYFNLNEGVAGGTNTSITTVLNKANANLNGTLTNFTKTGTTSNFVGSTISTFDITGAAAICANNTSQYTHQIAGGTWSVSSGAIATVNSNGLLTTSGSENITLSYTYTINGCSFTATKAVSVVTSAITVQPATTAQNLCINSTATALSITATNIGTTYQWYKNTTASNTGGTLITGATSASYTPLTTATGTLYYYCIMGGTCSPSDTSDVSGAITISAVSLVGAVSSSVASICDSGSTTLTLASNTGAIQWQSFVNSVWTDITGETATTYTTPSLTQNTTYRAKVTNGACASANSTSFIVPVYASPAAPTTSATTINYCQSATSTILAATALSGHSLQWYTQAVGGTPSVTAPTPSTATSGSTTYYVSQKAIAGSGNLDFAYNNSYANYISTFGQTFIPTGNVTVNSIILKAAYINNSNASTVLKIYNGFGGALLAAANSPFANVSSGWYYDITFSFSSQNLILTSGQTYYFEITSNSPMYPGYSSGYANGSGYINGGIITQDFAFKLDATLNSNPCESPRTAITVNVYLNPIAPTASNATLCLNSTPSPLTATAASGNTLQWYTVATGGTATTTAFTPSTSVSGTTNYYVSQKTDSSGCESPRATIAVTVPLAPYPYDRVVNFTNGGHLTKAAGASINLNDWTVEAWIYPTAWNYLAGIVSKQDFQFMTNSNGALSVMIERSWSWELTTTANNVVILNKWQHVAASYNASTKVVRIYVNGALVHTFTRTQGFVPDFNSYDLKIGYNNGQGNGGPSRTFAGNIDEVKIWNTVRTNTEISSNFATQLAGNESGLKAYYRFDQGIGGGNNTAITSLTDLTANANHLTPTSSSPVYTMNGATNNILQIGPAILSSPSICLNTTSTLTHTNSGGSWSSSDTTIISINSTTGSASALAVGTATITYTFTSNGCTFTSTKLFTVLDVPTVTIHPSTSTQNVCINTAATALSVTATGAGLTYQWYKNSTSSSTGGTLISGATSANYTPVTSVAGTLYYYCIVSGTCSPADTSNISGGIVVAPVSVAGTVSGTSSICSGSTTTLTLSGNVGTTIQWQRFDNPIWTDLTGETAATFTTPALTATTTYRASVTSGACVAAFTAGKVITVNPLPVISGLTTVGAGNQITLTATTTAASSNAWVSTNTSTLTVSNLGVVTGITPGNAAVIFTNNSGCKDTLDITVSVGTTLTPILTSPATNTTGATTLTINYTLPETPFAGSVSLTFTPVSGGTPIVWTMNNLTNPTFNYVVGSNPLTISNVVSGTALSFTTYNITLAYQDVYSNPPASVTNTNIQTLAPPNISFVNTSFATIVNTSFTINTINTGGSMVTYTINPTLPSGFTINSSTGVISGSSSVPLTTTTFTVTATNAAGTDTESFNFTIGADTDGDGIPDIADADVNGDGIPDNGTDTDGDGIIDQYDNDIDGDGIPNNLDNDADGDGLINPQDICWLTPNTAITVHPSTINQVICPSATIGALTVTATGPGLTYQWYKNTTNSTTGGTLIAGATAASYTPLNSVVGTVYYYVVVVGTCGSATSNASGSILVTDVTLPTVITQNKTVYLNAAGQATITPAQIDNGSTDNCSIATKTLNISSFNCSNIGANPVILSVTDASGNIQTGNATVTVLDSIKPSVVTQNITVYLNTAGQATITAAQINNGSSDNCGIASMILNQTTFSCANTGLNTVTLTVTDVNGNVKTKTAIVTVVDSILPTVITQNAILYLNASGQASITAAQINNGSFDNCGVASVVLSQTAFTCSNVGSNTVTLTVTDTKGNVATGNAIITIVDNTPPTVVVQNINAYLNTGGAVTITPSQVGGGSTDNCSIATMTLNNTTFNCSNFGANLVVLTVVDPSNNVSTATATITVIDSIKPLLTIPADITVFTNSGCGAFGFPIGSASASDNCSVISAITNNAPAFYPVGITNIQYSVTDGSGNTTIKIQKITVIDNIIPVITAPANINTTLTAGCTKTGINLGTPVTTDNCTIASVTNNAPVAFPVGTTIVTWTVTDASGNTSTATQTVTVTDAINPTITAPSNITVNANSSCVAFNVALGTPVTADNCTVASVTNNAPAVFTLGTTTVTWTVIDASGNFATTIQTVTVVDNINPSIIAPAAITKNLLSGCTYSSLTLGTPFTLDNCSIATITNNAPTTFPIGTTTVVWTVTDGSGNIATANQLITIVDNINPTITAPAAVTMNVVSGCSATGVVLGTPITADNCSVASVTNNAPATFPIGTTTVTWTVTDASGKTATANQLVTIVDNINPTISAPAAVSVNLTNGCAASNVVLGTPITADNCSVASITNNAPAIFQLGTTTVTWTVTDASGNSATSNQTVTVIDNINPTIVAPAAISMNVTSGCNVTGLALGSPFTSDNCSVATVANNAPTTFPIGTTTVVWTVTDGSGHTATANQLVTIVDNINPTITAPAAVTMNVVSGCSATGVVLGTPITADNCSVASVTNNAPATFPIGTTTVVWTVTDASGKTATATQLVTIVDNINPTITAPAAVSVTLTNGCTASNVVLGTPITADNCSVASVTNNAPAIFQLGTTTVTWTVTDASGLTATSNQTVTVIDNINPSIVAPAAISMNITSGCSVTGLALGTPYTADNCSVASVTNNAPTTFPIGSTTVTWTVTDGSGHTATATQMVTIIDNINPTITAPAAINSYIASGCSATGIVLGTPVTADNCSVASVTNNAPTSFPIGTTTVIWTVTDASGNSHTANQLVTVNDTLDPVITSPAAVTAYSNFGCQSVGVNLGTLTATDNCVIESITNNAPLFFPLGNTNVVWTVIDASGNSSTVTQLVTVVDTLKPTIIAPSNLEVASNTGCGASEISIGNPIVDDNCGVATINNDAPVVFVSGINIVTWTVTDNSGNVSTATQIVTVIDNVNPTAVLNNITVSLPVGSDAVITSDMIDNGSFDNCGNVTITLSQTNFNCDNIGNNTILVTVTDESGNFVSQSVVVTVNPSGIDLDLDGIDDACDQLIDQTVNVPNGFTPDGDGINDKFVVVGLDSYTSKALTIYNRYGIMVYETNNYQNDWDGSSNGSELPDGTYFYILELNGSETKSGYVYINRVH